MTTDSTTHVTDEGRGPTKHMFSAEASDLGWPPGHRPDVIAAHGRTFVFQRAQMDADGDVKCWTYQDGTAVLIVFND
jgi:hypothetical protein